MTMFKRVNIKNIYPVENATILYALLTTLLIVFNYDRMANPMGLIVERLSFVFIILILSHISKLQDNRWLDFGRYLFVGILLPYWYADTFEFNRILPNLDHHFAVWEQNIFGYQPALLFGEVAPWRWFSEAINFGYFFLYPMFAIFTIIIFLRQPRRFDKWMFVFLCTFYFYYLIFIFVPVAGPQFYFPAIGWDTAREAIFTPIGTYFDMHPDMIPNEPVRGPFSWIVHQTHLMGERPTGAFPSSHVGMSTVVMIAAWKYVRKYFWIVFPIYLFLVMATVYIKAHYLIDSVFGFISAFPFYYAAERIYKRLPHPHTKLFE